MSEQLSLHSATCLTKSPSLTGGKTTQSINDLQGQRHPCDWAGVLRQAPGEASCPGAWVKGLAWWKRSLEKEESRQNVWHSSVRRGNNLNSAEQFAQINLSLCYLLSCDTRHLRHLSQLPRGEAVRLWGHNQMTPLVTQILGS